MVDTVMDPQRGLLRRNFSKSYSSTNTAPNAAATLKTTSSCSTCSGLFHAHCLKPPIFRALDLTTQQCSGAEPSRHFPPRWRNQ